MNLQIILFLSAQAVVFAGAIIGSYVVLRERVTRIEVKFETFLLLLGNKVAKLMHSPTDHLGFDFYSEQYQKRHHEMSYDEWEALGKKCGEVERNPDATQQEQLMAAFIGMVCEHKLQCHVPRAKALAMKGNE